MIGLAQAQMELRVELLKAGLTIAPDAMKPLQQIDFDKLVAIYDHEQRFLEQTFIHTLVALGLARPSTSLDDGKITAKDVETAIRMLGVAVDRQAETTLTTASKSLIKDACGFC